MKNKFFEFEFHAALFYLLLQAGYCSSYNSRHDDVKCEIRKSICMYEVTCFENDNTPGIEYLMSNGQCKKTIEYNNDYYVSTTLIYKFNDNIASEGIFQNNDPFLRIITVLDISENQLYDQPNVNSEMDNLEKIIVSQNNLSKALFYNTNYELKSLKEIDFSYNVITTMEVGEYDRNEYVFKELNKINLSYNNMRTMLDFSFKNFKDLQYLDLSNNQISYISPNTFEGISSLKYLNVSFNNITDINTSLFRFKNLIQLNLSNNKISKILRHNVDSLNDLQFLDLSNNVISNIDSDVFDDLSRLANIDMSDNNIQRIGSNLFTRSIYLDNINLSYNNITQIPKNMFLGKNITMFSIKGNNITGILERGLFEGLDSITELDLSHQSVTFIGNYTFFGLTGLTKLLLNNNYISVLALNSFTTLKSLTFLDMSYNRITNLDFEKSDLSSLKFLEFSNNLVEKINVDQLFYLHRLLYLDLSQNNITRLEPKSFVSLSSLNNFLLSKNPLTGTLEEKTFDGLFGVPLLDLSGTSLNLIKNNSFDGMMHLYDLNISHSKIAEVQYNSFSDTENIEIIDLSFNRLENFAVNTSHLKSLRNLRLNNNNIKTLSQSFVKGLSHLNKIVLSHNKLLTLHSDTFQDQTFLNYLDLSFNLHFNIDFSLIRYASRLNTLILSGTLSNITFKEMNEMPLTRLDISNSQIQNISFLSLQKVKNIEILLLSNNNITQIDFGAFSNLSSIKEMDVSYNDIKSIEPGVFKDCHQLYSLNISHNSLSVIKYGIFGGLALLHVLDISYNHISNLETVHLHDLQELTELWVDHNRINEVSVDLGQTNIRKLSIGDNPLPCKSLIKLVKYSGPILDITSIRKIESGDENYLGISCNYHKHIPNTRIVQSEKIKNNDSFIQNLLFDIRDILYNISLKDTESNGKAIMNNKYDFEKSSQVLTDNLIQLNNISRNIEKDNKNTNQYLERLLKLVAAMNSLKPEVSILHGTSNTDINKNEVDKLKVEIDNIMVIEKEKILAEVSDKLSVINQRIDSLIYSTTVTPVSEHQTLSKEAKSPVFIEVCVILILAILICFILYKVYKSRCYIVNRWSTSTRHISDIENSNL